MQTKGKFILFDNTKEFSDWLSGRVINRPIHLIQNHHTYQPDYTEYSQLPDPFHWLQSMEDFQVKQEGFAQTAQNLTTFPDGRLAVGRPFDVAPAGILGANQYGICIEHMGNFDKDKINDIHQQTIISLNAILCKKFGLLVNVYDIVYHHWYDLVTGKRTNGDDLVGRYKTCPGQYFFGGNTVEACQKNFLPLVSTELSKL